MPPAENTGSESVWKILAEVTRENNQRDVRITELFGKLEAIPSLQKQFERAELRTQTLDDALRQLALAVRDLDSNKLSEGERRALRRIDDMLASRGVLDFLTAREIESLRDVIRIRPSYEQRLADSDVRLKTVEVWQEAHDDITDQRMETLHLMDRRVADLEQWKTTMGEAVDSQGTRLYELEWKSLKREETEEVRLALNQWNDFFKEYFDTIKKMVGEWNLRNNRQENIATFLATKKREVMWTLVILIPFTVLLTAIANWFISHH